MLICKENRINVINEKYFANFLQNSIIVHKQNKIQKPKPDPSQGSNARLRFN